MSIEQRAMAALARHERAVQVVAEITSQIGKALKKCPVNEIIEQSLFTGDAVDLLIDNKGRTKTHLWHALNGRDDDEVADYLDGEDCEHCAQAWALILNRQQIRQEVGIARRLIRHYGKLAIAMQEDHA